MASALCAVLLAFLLAACSNLPEIKQAPGLAPGLAKRCRAVFPMAPRQYVHSIEARLPDDSRANALGVVSVHPSTGLIHCVIMTLEGFVLFDARENGEMTIQRAAPPFDSPEFAKGLMADVRLVFLPPAPEVLQVGLLQNGFPGCRYKSPGGWFADLTLNEEKGWLLQRYDDSEHPSHRVMAYALNAEGIPETIEISRLQFPRYGLTLKLIRVERLITD